MKKGLPAKFLLVLGVLVFLFLLLTFAPQFLPNQSEYKKDQSYLASAMKTKLPQEPLPEVKYPIQGYRIPGIGGFCWLESSSGLIKYLEPDVDFDTFVFYSQPTLIMTGRNKKERWGFGLNQIHGFTQLGYTTFIASTSPVDFPENVYPDLDPRHFIYFKTKDEELNFIKRLISAGLIPTINYDGDFSTIVGYNKKGFWIVRSDATQTDRKGNFMTYPLPFEPFFATYKEFEKNWRLNHQFFWFEKTGARKSIEEVYNENKKNAQEAPANLRLVIDYLKKGGSLIDYTSTSDLPAAMTLYRYFQKRNNPELADTYLEIAKTYEAQRVALSFNKPDRNYLIKSLTEVLPLYEKASTLWP